MIKLLFINNQPDVAAYAVAAGVNRIFIDLEVIGKKERQGHLNTWITDHKITDINLVRHAIGNAELLVRLNPIHEFTSSEINEAIARGADILMLPMYKTNEEVAKFLDLVKGRAKVIPLLETASALRDLEKTVSLGGLHEIYIGLNDLHLDLKLNFMFEPLINGMMDNAAEIIKKTGLPFGFGGLARIGEGAIPAEKILGQHVRLGSTSVILSRTFCRQVNTLNQLKNLMDMSDEIKKIHDVVNQYKVINPKVLIRELQDLHKEILKMGLVKKLACLS